MHAWRDCYDAFGAALDYPDATLAGKTVVAVERLTALVPELSAPLRAFAAYAANPDITALEESFTATFDINAVCALETGWHLFGEEYMRGAFLVRLRQEQARLGAPTSTELPDHLSHVLQVLGRMPDAEADDFARRCVIPALEQMREKLAGAASPYAALVGTIHAVLQRRHVAPVVAAAEQVVPHE
jgi:nitrate reductase delta subunit